MQHHYTECPEILFYSFLAIDSYAMETILEEEYIFFFPVPKKNSDQ
jgi:hypothetical protein